MTAYRSLAMAAALMWTAMPLPAAAQAAGQSQSTAEFDQFLAQVAQARHDFVNGNPATSAQLNATVLPFALLGGAGGIVTDPAAVAQQQGQVSNLYRDGTVAIDYTTKVVSGDMAYTVGTERRVIKIGERTEESNLRVTQVYRKENGSWKIVVRHADALLAYQAPTAASFRQPAPPQTTP